MTPAQIDQEIAKRRDAISRAERTIADTQRAPYVSEPTTKALAELVKVVAAERVVLAELRKYRSALTV
ncbi:MAG: hypothetical protein ABMA14_17630 [Hyphomonadaceae bacterium]